MAPFRYKKLGYVALNVTDVGRTSEFARDIVGLTDAGRGERGEQYFRCSRDHHNVVLYPAEEPGFKRGSWQLETDDDVQQAFSHFEALGLNPAWLSGDEAEPLALSFAPAFRVREPVSGACFEYFSKMEQKGRDFVPTHTKIVRPRSLRNQLPGLPRQHRIPHGEHGFQGFRLRGRSVRCAHAGLA